METVDVAALRTAFRRSGSGSALVLLHGAYEDSRVWANQIAGLSERHTVIAPDLPGHGASEDPPGSWTIDEYSRWLVGFFSAVGAERPHVLGLSFGSVLALAGYAYQPTAFRSLILASAYAGWAGSLPDEEVRRRLAQVLAELDSPPERIVEGWLPTLLTESASEQVRDLVVKLMTDFHPQGMRVALNAFGTADLRPVLPTIKVPTLLIYGSRDVRSPANTVGADLLARIPDATMVTLDGAPHMANLEQPEAFNRAVDDFLGSLSS